MAPSAASATPRNHVIDDEDPETDNELRFGEEERQFYEPTHIWYAATIFPLSAACFGPLASALSICALVEDWRVLIPAGGDESSEVMIPDPAWLIAINAASLGIAILANLSLLLSMAHRLPFTIAQPVTIVGWYISSILLLVLISLTPVHLQANTLYSFAQPFVYACLAAALYFILASLLVLTTYGAYKKYYSPDFSSTLTLPQRTIMAQSTCFIIYLLCGAVVFAHIEGWRFVNGVYWATITVLTIGYGDIVPVTHLGRSLIIPYAIAGIIMLGLVAGSIGSLVIDRASQKMVLRLTVRQREKLRSEILDDSSTRNNSSGREKAEFNLMREIQSRARSRQRWSLLGISTTALLLLWFVGALVFWETESASTSFQTAPWTYFDAVYFVFISLLTIGYGDFAVRSNVGRPLFVFWGLLAIPTMTILIASMGATVLVVIKGMIAKIDSFVVLPHESRDNGKRNSFTRKAFHMGKLKAKAKVGVEGEGHERGLERHGDGIRDPDTGRVMSVERQTAEVPHVDHKHDEAVRQRRFLIAKEITGLLEDAAASPPKRYTYEEWARFLKLMGIRRREVDMLEEFGDRDEKDAEKRWNWLGDDGPLFGTKSETEWLLGRLSKQLEDLLRPS